MASPLRIPDIHLPALRAIAGMSDMHAEHLRAALGEMPSRLSKPRLAQRVADAVPDLDPDPSDLLEALLSLAAFVSEMDEAAIGQAAEDVAASPDLELDDAVRGGFAMRLRALLRLEPVVLAARAHDLFTEYERVFHGARVLTDLRPVFGTDVSAGAKVVAGVATLKIEAHEGHGPLRSYYFAMDHADLLRLREVIDRALAKTTAMKQLAERIDLAYWEYEEVDDAENS